MTARDIFFGAGEETFGEIQILLLPVSLGLEAHYIH